MAMTWSVEKISQFYRRLDLALDEYEAYCHHAASVMAPKNRLWEEEALWASQTKRRFISRAIDMLEYATTRSDDALRKIEMDDSNE